MDYTVIEEKSKQIRDTYHHTLYEVLFKPLANNLSGLDGSRRPSVSVMTSTMICGG